MTLVLNGTTGVSSVDGSASTPAIQGNDTNTGVFFPAADTVAIATGGTERVRTDSSGNVGIGTSSPSYKLDVSGEIRTTSHVRGTGSDVLYVIGGASNNNNNIYVGGSSAGTANTIAFTTAGSERARIDSSGNLVQASGCRIYSPGTYNNTTGNAANMHIATDGHFFRSTSSLKYKTDVQDAVHGLAEVLALRPVTYKGKNDGDLVFGGLIAEEVHEAGLTEFVQYAQDGSPDALAYGNMVALCIKAIQELNAKVEALEAQLAGAAS